MFKLDPGQVAVQVGRPNGGHTVMLVWREEGKDTYRVRDRCLDGVTPDGTDVDEGRLTLEEAMAAASNLARILTKR